MNRTVLWATVCQPHDKSFKKTKTKTTEVGSLWDTLCVTPPGPRRRSMVEVTWGLCFPLCREHLQTTRGLWLMEALSLSPPGWAPRVGWVPEGSDEGAHRHGTAGMGSQDSIKL